MKNKQSFKSMNMSSKSDPPEYAIEYQLKGSRVDKLFRCLLILWTLCDIENLGGRVRKLLIKKFSVVNYFLKIGSNFLFIQCGKYWEQNNFCQCFSFSCGGAYMIILYIFLIKNLRLIGNILYFLNLLHKISFKTYC